MVSKTLLPLIQQRFLSRGLNLTDVLHSQWRVNNQLALSSWYEPRALAKFLRLKTPAPKSTEFHPVHVYEAVLEFDETYRLKIEMFEKPLIEVKVELAHEGIFWNLMKEKVVELTYEEKMEKIWLLIIDKVSSVSGQLARAKEDLSKDFPKRSGK